MHHVSMSAAIKVMTCIRNHPHDPLTVALWAQRDTWLLENDLGVLSFAPGVREILEQVG